MKKHVVSCAVIILAIGILSLVGQLYFPSVPNLIIIATLVIFSMITVSIFGAVAASKKELSAEEKDPEKEEQKSVPEKRENLNALKGIVSKEDGIIASLFEKMKDKELELEKLKRENSSLSAELEEEREKVLSLSNGSAGKEGENNDAMSALLPLSDENDSNEINIINVCKDAIKDLSKNARKANLMINISATEESLLVKASRKRLLILFKNIIDNSIKYMNRQGSLTITISNIGSDIFIVLKDTGEGLTESETRHIFELNYQGSNRISGNGLGLAQAKAIVDYYGGTIYAKSNVNQGMAIYIQLPTT